MYRCPLKPYTAATNYNTNIGSSREFLYIVEV